jgi:hypothetical protein
MAMSSRRSRPCCEKCKKTAKSLRATLLHFYVLHPYKLDRAIPPSLGLSRVDAFQR